MPPVTPSNIFLPVKRILIGGKSVFGNIHVDLGTTAIITVLDGNHTVFGGLGKNNDRSEENLMLNTFQD